MLKNFEEKFNFYCDSNNLEINQNQFLVIKKLQDYYKKNFRSFISKFLSKENSKKSFYLYGDVGVGKTMILDFFFSQIKQKKKRLHFNEFMLNFHDFVQERKNKKEQNIISLFVKDLKLKVSLIYFDEFQVTNIVDAMILGKLFEEMFKANIKMILTSNTKISDLYKDAFKEINLNHLLKLCRKNLLNMNLKLKMIIEN